MRYDISEIGQINCTLNFDKDEYEDYLSTNGLKDTEFVKESSVKEYCDYTVEFFDSEYFHHMGNFEDMTYDEIEEEFGYELASDVLKLCMDGDEQSFEILAYQNAEVDLNDTQAINSAAMKCLRHGGYYKNCRGFILTNGVVVYTDSEHNECTRINGVNGTHHFIKLGNIRVLDHSIDMAKYPTAEQFKTLDSVLDCYTGEHIYLDLMGGIGTTSIEYLHCDAEQVKTDIEDYFGGKIKRKYVVRESFEVRESNVEVPPDLEKILKESEDLMPKFNENDSRYFPLLESVRNGLMLEKMGVSANAEGIYTNLKHLFDDNVREWYREAESRESIMQLEGFPYTVKKIYGFNIFGDTKITIELYIVGTDIKSLYNTVRHFRLNSFQNGFDSINKTLSLLIVFNKENSEWYDPTDKLAHEARHVYNFIMSHEKPQYIKVSRDNYNLGLEAVRQHHQFIDFRDDRYYIKYIGMAFYYMNRDEMRAYTQKLYQKIQDMSFLPADRIIAGDETYRNLSTLKNALNVLPDYKLAYLLQPYNKRKEREVLNGSETKQEEVLKNAAYFNRLLLYAKRFRKSVNLMLTDYMRAIGKVVSLLRGDDAL